MTFGHERAWRWQPACPFPHAPAARHQAPQLSQPCQGFPCSPGEPAPRPALARPKAPWPGHRPAGAFGGEKAREAALRLWKRNPPIGKYAGLMSLIDLLEQITFCDHPDESRKAKEDHYFHFKLTSLLIGFWLFMLLGCLCQMGAVFVYLFACLFVCFIPGTEVCQVPSQHFFITASGHQPHTTSWKRTWTFSSLTTQGQVELHVQSWLFWPLRAVGSLSFWGESLAEIHGVDTRLQPPAVNVYSDRGVYFWTMSANNFLS